MATIIINFDDKELTDISAAFNENVENGVADFVKNTLATYRKEKYIEVTNQAIIDAQEAMDTGVKDIVSKTQDLVIDVTVNN